MEGWISLHRKIMENPILNRSRVYSNFEAWIWLLLKANHKDNKFMLGSKLIKVYKGEMVTSQQKLCKQFRWGNTKLRNFLKVLQEDEMILLKTNILSTHITICNYDTYQDRQTANKSQTNRKQTANKSRTNTNNKDNNANNVNKLKDNIFIKENIKKYGVKMLGEFVDHYTEKKPNGRKEKWEMEKTFDYNLRLQYWARKDYNGNYKEHKEKLINQEKEEYYRKAEQQVSEEESLRQKEEIKNLSKGILRKMQSND